MKVLLIEAPTGYISDLHWEDVYFPDAAFPISDFLNHEQNQAKVFNYQVTPFDMKAFLQELQTFQPVVVGINDHQTTNGLVLQRVIKQMFPRALLFFSPTQMTLEHLLDKANESAYNLRHRTRPVAGKLRLRSAWKSPSIFEHLSPKHMEKAESMASRYIEQYHFEDWKQRLEPAVFRKNLYMFEILEDLLPKEAKLWEKDTLRILDVGAGDWSYAPAIYHFFQQAYTDTPRTVYLTGIEIDPYRTDAFGYSKVDYARSYVDPMSSHCRYLVQDILEYHPESQFDVLLQFLPFVLEKAHLFWGLPLAFFKPLETIQHLQELASPEAYLLIANEIQAEFETQKDLLKECQITPEIAGAFFSHLRQGYMGYVSTSQLKQ